MGPWTFHQQFMKEFLWGGLVYLPRDPVGKIIDILGLPTNHLVGGWLNQPICKNMQSSKLDHETHETPRFGMKISPTFELPPPSNAKFSEFSKKHQLLPPFFRIFIPERQATCEETARQPAINDGTGIFLEPSHGAPGCFDWNPTCLLLEATSKGQMRNSGLAIHDEHMLNYLYDFKYVKRTYTIHTWILWECHPLLILSYTNNILQ